MLDMSLSPTALNEWPSKEWLPNSTSLGGAELLPGAPAAAPALGATELAPALGATELVPDG